MPQFQVNITWKRPKQSSVTIEAASQAEALTKVTSAEPSFRLNPATDADRVEVRLVK